MAPAVMGGATRSRSRGRPQLLLIGLVVLVAVSLLLALRSSLQSQPAEPTVRISPSSVEAGVAVTLTVTPVLHTLRLQPVGGGEAIPVSYTHLTLPTKRITRGGAMGGASSNLW